MKLYSLAVWLFVLSVFAVYESTKADCIEMNLKSSWNKYYRMVMRGAKAITSMKLLETYSMDPCTYKFNYGFLGGDVWVNKNCHGRFLICFVKGFSWTVTCKSDDSQLKECVAVIPEISTILLSTHHSSAPCISDYSYGVTEVKVWVDKGCQATFHVSG